jgi:hypothetical protein
MVDDEVDWHLHGFDRSGEDLVEERVLTAVEARQVFDPIGQPVNTRGEFPISDEGARRGCRDLRIPRTAGEGDASHGSEGWG